MLFSCNNKCPRLELEDLEVPEQFLEVNLEGVEFFKFPKSKGVILKYLNSDCSVCLAELKDWIEFADNFISKDNIELIFIVSGFTRQDAEYPFYLMHLEAPFFYDSAYLFMDANQISASRSQQAIIVNDNGQIIHRGSPFSSKGDLSCFLRKIKDLHD